MAYLFASRSKFISVSDRAPCLFIYIFFVCMHFPKVLRKDRSYFYMYIVAEFCKYFILFIIVFCKKKKKKKDREYYVNIVL